jgi:tRNA(Arg) A34 adenosine deaminase TadA
VLAKGRNLSKQQRDSTAHGEMVAIRRFLAEYGPEELKGTTLYTSGESCPMCMGAIVWCGISRVVYGASIAQLATKIGQIMKPAACWPQLIAAHNAAMECHRRAMLSEQTFEGRRENLNQANRLSRTYATLLEALNRHRGKGQQKVTVEHVHVHSGGQAVVGVVEPAGGGDRKKSEDQLHAKPIVHAP